MVEASCHCGAVRLQIDSAPQTVTDCNCSICRRYGVLWAYYPTAEVRFAKGGQTENDQTDNDQTDDDRTDIYMWNGRSLEFHRCRTCGCVTHWSAVDKNRDKMGINARLLVPDVLAAARVRRLDGAHTGAYLD